MAGREPDRAFVGGQIVEAEGLRLTDEHPENAAALRELADRLDALRLDPVGEEPLQPGPGWVDHAQCRIPSLGQHGRHFEQAPQDRIERQLGCDRHAGLEERAQTTVSERLLHSGRVAQAAARAIRVLPRSDCGFAASLGDPLGQLMQRAEALERPDPKPFALPGDENESRTACRRRASRPPLDVHIAEIVVPDGAAAEKPEAVALELEPPELIGTVVFADHNRIRHVRILLQGARPGIGETGDPMCGKPAAGQWSQVSAPCSQGPASGYVAIATPMPAASMTQTNPTRSKPPPTRSPASSFTVRNA